MAKKKSPPPKHTTEQILKQIRDLRARTEETMRKMKALELTVAASLKRK